MPGWKRIDRDALFADETTDYRFPGEIEPGDEVTFRFRTGRDDAKNVYLIGSVTRRRMEKVSSAGRFDYYETRITVGNERFFYCFEIEGETETLLFNRLGVSREYHFQPRFAFRVMPGFHVPGWAKGAVMYQIYVDRFMNGDPKNDVLPNEYRYMGRPVEHAASWDELPKTEDVHRFYGGDLIGVRKKLDYLEYLGVEAIYLNPIFVSPSNHKYDTQDYDHVDPHLTGFVKDEGEVLPKQGSAKALSNRDSSRYVCRVTDPKNLAHANEVFRELIEEIHKRGMKIILDGVFNHCGSFNKWMDEEHLYEGKPGYQAGAYVSKDSPYHDYFYFDEDSEWPDRVNYLGWWNHKTLPKLNYEKSRELTEYVMRIGEKWVGQPFNADGWRLDVAADLGRTKTTNHAFWREFRTRVKGENPEALIVAEHYGDASAWLRGDEWDTVMNYDAFMEPVGFFLTGMEKHSDEYNSYLHGNGEAFFHDLAERMTYLPSDSLYSAMNELSNHDHSRFLTRTNSTVGRLETRGSKAAGEGVSYATFREGVIMQFTLPGAPTVYYGDEAGVVGWTDPDNRRTYPWGHENWDLIAFHRDVIRIHKKYRCFRKGSFKALAAGYGFVVYARFDMRSSAVVFINHSEKDRKAEIPVWPTGVPDKAEMTQLIQTNDAAYNVGAIRCPVSEGLLTVTVPAWSATVYYWEKPVKK